MQCKYFKSPNFGLNIFIHISIYSNIQIYILQYNHYWTQIWRHLFVYVDTEPPQSATQLKVHL